VKARGSTARSVREDARNASADANEYLNFIERIAN
jgi:hypothetical protein